MLSRVLVAALFIFIATTAWGRPWTDRTGRVIEAKYVRLNGDSVVLLQGTKVVTVPLANLCDSDQEYVRQQVAPKPKPKDGEKTPADPTAKPADPTSKPADPAVKPTDPEKKPETPATPQLAEGERLWTDIRGNQLAAKFIRVESGQVYLSHNGIEKAYPVVGFSVDDQKLIASLAPPPPPPSPPPSMPSPMPTPPHSFPRPNMARMPERPSMSSFPERPPMPTVTHTPPPTPHFEPPRMAQFEPPRPTPAPMPTYTPPPPTTMPSIPSPFASSQSSDKACSKCNKPAPANAKAGDTCKHCGTTWGVEKDEKGNVVGYSSGYMAGKIAGGVFAVIVILSALLRFFNR